MAQFVLTQTTTTYTANDRGANLHPVTHKSVQELATFASVDEARVAVRKEVLALCEKKGIVLPNWSPDDLQYGEFCDDPMVGCWLVNKVDGREFESWRMTRSEDCILNEVYVEIALDVEKVGF